MSDPLDLGSSLDAQPQPSAPAAGDGRSHLLGARDLRLPPVPTGRATQLTATAPVVELSGEQSTTGTLTVHAAIPNPGDLILVAAYETVDRREGIAVPSLRPGGPDPARPIVRAAFDVSVDLGGVESLRRIFIAGVPRRSDLRMPGGTLATTMADGSRLDLRLGDEVTNGAKALLTVYIVAGRIVVRAEHDPFSGTLQQVCGAYGYHGLSWRNAFTPL